MGHRQKRDFTENFFISLKVWTTCCCCSVIQLYPTLLNPMDYSTLGFPVLHRLPELTQTYVHWVDEAIQSSCPMSCASPLAFSLSQHQKDFSNESFSASESFLMSQLFASGGQSIGVSALASVLPMNIQGWFPLGLTSLISLQSRGPARVFSNITVQKHQFFGTQPSLLSSSHIHA